MLYYNNKCYKIILIYYINSLLEEETIHLQRVTVLKYKNIAG